MKTVHKRRLLALAALLKKLPPKRFTMRRWVGWDWSGDPTLSCGTSACALGWATTIPSLRRLGLRLDKGEGCVVLHRRGHRPITSYYNGYLDIAALLFGLDEQEAERVFMPRHGYDNTKAKAAQIIALVKSKK